MCVLRVWLDEGSIIWTISEQDKTSSDKSPVWTKDPGRKPPLGQKSMDKSPFRKKPPDKGHLDKKTLLGQKPPRTKAPAWTKAPL